MVATQALDFVKLLSRSQTAETLLKELRQKVATLRQQVVAAETDRLTRENAELTLQCQAWRHRLIKAETDNGKKQYPLPERSISTDAAGAAEKSTQSAEVERPPKATETSAGAVSAAGDSKKSAKPAKESKPKGSAGKESKPKEPNTKQENKQGSKPADGAASSDAVCVSQLDLRVGVIKEVGKHPDADALYLEQIDVGEEKPRTVISGLVKFVPLEEMQNRTVVVMCNLKPAKMRGILSEGMVMCASTPDKVEPIRPPKDAVPGDRVTWTGLSGDAYPAPESVLNPKKKIWERIAPELKIDENGNTVWMNKLLEVRGKGPITADSLRSVNVK